MDEDKKTMILIKAVAWFCVTVIVTIGGCNMHIDYRIAKAIEGGADPILARAALSNSDGSVERVIHIAKKSNR